MIKLACTIGPADAGIIDELEREFAKQTGVKVSHIKAGTGEALNIARSGKVDLVMVHAKRLEEQFIAEGFGTTRLDLMFNDFLILGPSADPAQIKGLKNAVEAFRLIAEKQLPFVSRGDNSGTHVKERELWQAAGLGPADCWYEPYVNGAQGNAATLRYANTKNAYTLIDRATYITLKQEIDLQIMVEKDELLLNFISLIPLNPNKLPQVNHSEAKLFVDWLMSREGQQIILDFGKSQYHEPLFFPNSPVGKTLV